MSNNKFYIALILILGLGSYCIYSLNQQPKIAVVDFNKLVMDYEGMKEATVLYESKALGWEKQTDSLKQEMDAIVRDLESNEYDKETVYKKEYVLVQKRKDYTILHERLTEQAQEEDYKMTTSVLNQVTTFLDTYGKANGYDIIYGKNEGNYILYKTDKFDITEPVLKALNAEYNGE